MKQNDQPEAFASWTEHINRLATEERPFVCILDYALQKPLVIPVDEIDPLRILYDFDGITNVPHGVPAPLEKVEMAKTPVSFSEYRRVFDQVMDALAYGNSFLLNLTFQTEVRLNRSLRELFSLSRAKYKLFVDRTAMPERAGVPDAFLVFSPETFVRIREGRISAYPMKGTIDAAVPDAHRQILDNPKEKAEHVTIVDLLRNDLSRVATDVSVDRFRYIEEVRTHEKTLLQVSSEISGRLPEDYRHRLGDILHAMLPAGSVSGAPKVKTVGILRNAETYDRGYFTGICVLFDGRNLDSGVMIRYIEQHGDKYFFKSGGGITTQSTAEEEYQEMIDKVYVPIH